MILDFIIVAILLVIIVILGFVMVSVRELNEKINNEYLMEIKNEQ